MFSIEAGIAVFIATQLITYGALRQQVKDLAGVMIEEKREREKLSERVRALEISSPALVMTKKSGL